MLPNRIRISKRATESLKQIKGRVGITPNVLCRVALMLSLNDDYSPNLEQTDLDGTEFNSVTLFGEHALLYECLLRECHGDRPPKDMQLVLAAHIDNGVDKLRRVKSASDVLTFAADETVSDLPRSEDA